MESPSLDGGGGSLSYHFKSKQCGEFMHTHAHVYKVLMANAVWHKKAEFNKGTDICSRRIVSFSTSVEDNIYRP